MRLDALLEVGVVEQPELGVVDQLVFLPLTQRLDGEPELLLGLVHRPVVEVGDPRVDPQDGLGDGEFVLARLQLVVDEGGRQVDLAGVTGRQGDRGLAVFVLRLPCGGAERLDVGVKAGRGLPYGGEVGAGEREEGAGGLGGDRAVVAGVGVQQGVLAEAVAVREYRDGDRPTVRALAGLADAAVGDQVDPVRRAAALDKDLTGGEVALHTAFGEDGQDVHVVEAPQQGQFTEFAGDHPDRGAVLDELDAPVADGVPEPPVDPVGAALGLDPGEHPQQPAGGDLLHLRGGLGGGGEVAGGCGAEGLLRHCRYGLDFRAAVHGHRCAVLLAGHGEDRGDPSTRRTV